MLIPRHQHKLTCLMSFNRSKNENEAEEEKKEVVNWYLIITANVAEYICIDFNLVYRFRFQFFIVESKCFSWVVFGLDYVCKLLFYLYRFGCAFKYCFPLFRLFWFLFFIFRRWLRNSMPIWSAYALCAMLWNRDVCLDKERKTYTRIRFSIEHNRVDFWWFSLS